ncbi:MAG TPA: DUF5005 domain-containing protein [Bacteroidales bacterium]|nr:DUF5005 domain-containing protein [Bacteroidales bacterium]
MKIRRTYALLSIFSGLGFILLSLTPVNARGPVEDSLFNDYFHGDMGGWIAGDATYSISLPNGRTLWLFGDSFIGEVNPDNTIAPGAKMIRNAAVIQDGNSFTTLTGGSASNPQTFIQTDHPDSTWYWPEHGILENDTLFIFVSKFHESDGPAGYNFEMIGNDIVMFDYPSMNYLGISEVPYYFLSQVIYGDRVMQDGDYLYIYGRKEEDPDYHIPYPHLARARTGNITGGWEFFDGSGWSKDPTSSAKINTFQVSQQYAVFKHENRYVLLTQDIWLSSKIWTFTSTTPHGPWQYKTLVYTTPKPYDTQVTYNAYAHPQFDDNNQLLVSYNSNGDFLKIFGNVDLYKPRFIRISYHTIDASFEGPTGTSDLLIPANDSGTPVLYPNPCTSYATIEYHLNTNGYVSLGVFDIHGRLTGSYINEEQYAGIHRFKIPVTKLDNGLYFFRIQLPGKTETGKFIKSSGFFK